MDPRNLHELVKRATSDAPAAAILGVALMASLFFMLSTYSLISAIRIPLDVLQGVPEGDLAKVLVASCASGLCIGFPFGEAVRHMRHAGVLWRQAPMWVRVKVAVLYGLASGGLIGLPLWG